MSVVCGCVSVHTGVADVDVLHRSIEDGWLKTAVLLTNKGKRGHFLEGHKKIAGFHGIVEKMPSDLQAHMDPARGRK